MTVSAANDAEYWFKFLFFGFQKEQTTSAWNAGIVDAFNILKTPIRAWNISLHFIYEFSWISTSFSDTSAHPLDYLTHLKQHVSHWCFQSLSWAVASGHFFRHGSTRLTELHPPTYREHHAASGFGSRSTSRTPRCLSCVGKSDKLTGM